MSSWSASYDEQLRTERGENEVGNLTSGFGNMMAGGNDVSTQRDEQHYIPPPQTSFGASQFGFNTGLMPINNLQQPFGAQRGAHIAGFQDGFMSQGAFNQNTAHHNVHQLYSNSSQPQRGARGATRGSRGGSRGNHSSASITSPLPTRRFPIEEAGEKPMNPEDIALLNKFLHRTVKMMADGTVDIQKQQEDPKSPLHSAVDFRDLRLRPELLKALDVMHYHRPSKIQEFTLPLLLMEPPTNMIAQSQSGTGKTAAFVLAMLCRIIPKEHYPQAICLAPTYELAMQIGEVVNNLAAFLPDIKVHYAVKGQPRVPPGASLTEQIIIGTPGRMIDYLTKMRCFNPSKIICLVLDEADVMISQQGHLDLSHRIYNTIEQASPKVQAMLFSATYDSNVMDFAEKLIKDAVSVTLKKRDLALDNIKQYFVECRDRDAKYEAVCDLYSGLIIASSVIFTRTRSSATWLTEKLRSKGHEVVLLHGDMNVEERASAIDAFKKGVYKVLITTNVCSRGIDVSQVTIVINYDLPYYIDRPTEPDYETYLHRIGRTGRFGKAGIAINFIDSMEDLELVRKLEKHFDKPIPKLNPSNIDELEAIEKKDN